MHFIHSPNKGYNMNNQNIENNEFESANIVVSGQEIDFKKMLEDLDKKASKINIVAWVSIGIAVALVIPLYIAQFSFNEAKEQRQLTSEELKEQTMLIKEQEKLINSLSERLVIVETKLEFKK